MQPLCQHIHISLQVIQDCIILYIKFCADFGILQSHIYIQWPQMFHIQMQQCADLSVFSGKIFLVGIYKQFSRLMLSLP